MLGIKWENHQNFINYSISTGEHRNEPEFDMCDVVPHGIQIEYLNIANTASVNDNSSIVGE